LQQQKWTFGLAIFFIIASLISLLVWIPNDIETGVIERFRRQITIGDAMAPTMVAWGVLFVSIALLIDAILSSRAPRASENSVMDAQSFVFLFKLTIVIIIALLLMYYGGPLLVDFLNLVNGESNNYRLLKGSPPYKYIGYILGGFVMVFGSIGVVENKFSTNGAWLPIIAVTVLTLLYDVPFDNLLLPPNGDY
jgi:hypothetical protein